METTTSLRAVIVTKEDIGKPVIVFWLGKNNEPTYVPSILLEIADSPIGWHTVYDTGDKMIKKIGFEQIVKVGETPVEVCINLYSS